MGNSSDERAAAAGTRIAVFGLYLRLGGPGVSSMAGSKHSTLLIAPDQQPVPIRPAGKQVALKATESVGQAYQLPGSRLVLVRKE